MSENTQISVGENASNVEAVQRKPHLRDFLPKTADKKFASIVDDIRELRKIDRSAAKEKIDEFRKEVSKLQKRGMKLQDKFFGLIEENADIPTEVMLEKFEEDDLTSEELDILRGVKHELDGRREMCVKITNALRKKAITKLGFNGELGEEQDDMVRSEMAKFVFKATTGEYPEGEVKFIESDFVIGFKTTTDVDSKKVDTRNVGGHYGSAVWVGNLPLDFGEIIGIGPLKKFDYIFIAHQSKPSTIKHETGHAMNNVFFKVLKEQGFLEKYWGGEKNKWLDKLRVDNATRSREIVARALSDYEKGKIGTDVLEEKIRKSMGVVLSDVLSKAKDEIVTDFVAQGSFDHNENLKRSVFGKRFVFEDLKKIYDHNKYYDYFDVIGFSAKNFYKDQKLRSVYDNLASEYNEILSQSVEQMGVFFSACDEFGLQKKYRSKLEGFLRQNPLETWSKRFALEFGKEADEVINAYKFVTEYKKGLVNLDSGLALGRSESLNNNDDVMWLKEHRGIVVDGSVEISERAEVNSRRIRSMLDEISSDGQRGFGSVTDIEKIKILMRTSVGDDSPLARELILLKAEEEGVGLDVKQYYKKVNAELVRQAKGHPIEVFLTSEDEYSNSRYNERPSEDLYWDDLISTIDKLPSIKVDGNRFSDTYSPTSFVFDVAEGRSGESIEMYRRTNRADAAFLETKIVPIFMERRKIQDQIAKINLENDDLRRELSAKISDHLNPPNAYRGSVKFKRQEKYGTTKILDFYDQTLEELPEGERKMILENRETQRQRQLLVEQIKQLDQKMIGAIQNR